MIMTIISLGRSVSRIIIMRGSCDLSAEKIVAEEKECERSQMANIASGLRRGEWN